MVLRNTLILLISLLLPAAAFAANKYVVKKGDNLYDLSGRFGVSVDDLKSTNNLSGNRLDIGDELIIPNTGNAKDSDNNGDGSNTKEYVVRKGDTLGEIAGKYGLTASDLQSENGLKTTKLQIGQKLSIPSALGSSEKTAVTVTADQARKAGTSSPTEKSNSVYTVKSGDTLGHIADRHGMSSRELKAANGLSTDRLSIGQTLVIPSVASVTAAAPVKERPAESPAVVTTAAGDGFYVVGKGDTPGGIAQKLGVGTQELIELNNIDSKSLQIGQKLSIPGKGEAERAAVQVDAKPKEEKTETTAPAGDVPADEYIVRKGDTPGAIAARLGVSTRELMELNNVNSKSLQIGQELSVPGSNLKAKADKPSGAETPAETGESSQATEPVKETSGTTATPSEHIVRKGDTLYDLSREYGLPVDFIKKNNGLKNNNLRVGQRLALTSSGTVTADSGTDGVEAPATEPADIPDKSITSKYTGSYTVRKGDTLGQLALRHGVPLNELRKVNGLKGSDIRVGQELAVPGRARQDVVVAVESEAAPAPSNEIYIKKRYVVKQGDTLGAIASGFGVTVDDIKKASALKTDSIGKGDTLLIPVPQEKVTSSQYVVAKGDTLGKLGLRFGVSVRELKDANNLRGDTLRVGMKLNIPGMTPSEPVIDVGSAVTAAPPKQRTEYVVRKGESLGSIARRHGVTVTELKRENNIKGSVIRAGQVLYIPGGASGEAAYVAVAEKNTIKNSNGHLASSNGHPDKPGAEVQNGRFSKESIIQVAKKYLGAPYKFGGNDFITGIDCSGYVKKVFGRFNVNLPRTARDIYYRSGESVRKTELDSGDLVFFTTYAKYPSHVGIYIGNDEFIHASSASRMVTIDSINKQYYRKRYIGAKRVQLSGLFYDEMSREYSGFERN